MHRQARSIGGGNGSGLAKLRHACEQTLFDVQIFGYDFNDPVRVLATLQIVFKISNGDFVSQRRSKKRCRLGLFCGIQTGAHNFVALRRVARGRARWHNIKQEHRDAGVREMSRDPGAHRSRAEHHDLFDATFHGWPFFSDLYERTGYKTNIHGSIELTQTSLAPKLITACLNRSFRACCASGWTKKSVFCPLKPPAYTGYPGVQKL